MKIKQLEELLGVSKANIRFYESEGLLHPKRGENNYRDYDDDDVQCLKKILVFRKLGLSIAEIHSVQNGELHLQEAVANSLSRLEEEKKQLEGSINLCKNIQSSLNETAFDTNQYWDLIAGEEQKGHRFVDLARDYLLFEKGIIVKGFALTHFINIEKIIGKHGTLKGLLILLGILLIRAIMAYVWRGENVLVAFATPFVEVLIVALLTLPMFLLAKNKKYERIGQIYVKILLWVCLLFLLGVVVVFVLALLGII